MERSHLLAQIVGGGLDAIERGAHMLDIALVAEAERHGVELLLRRALKKPIAVLNERARVETLIEAYRRRSTERLMTEFKRAAVAALVFKGAAVAYTHYPAP